MQTFACRTEATRGQPKQSRPKERVKVTCLQCGKVELVQTNRAFGSGKRGPYKYCSINCHKLAAKGRKPKNLELFLEGGKKSRFQQGGVPPNAKGIYENWQEIGRLYEEEKLTLGEIAQKFNCTVQNIHKILREKFGREFLRDWSEAKKLSYSLGKSKPLSMKGRPAWNKGKKSLYPAWNKGISWDAMRGDKNPSKRLDVREKLRASAKKRMLSGEANRVCIDCGKVFVSFNKLAKKCRNCHEKYRQEVYVPRYRKSEARKLTLRKYYSTHKEKESERTKEWAKKNPGKILASSKRYREKNKEKLKQKRKELYWANPEKLRAKAKEYRLKNPGKATLQRLRYKQSEKGRATIKAVKLRRYARQKGASGKISGKDILNLSKLFDCCIYCGGKEDLTIEHLIPLAKGGANESNLVLACRKCNSSKRDKMPEVWFKENPAKYAHFKEIVAKRPETQITWLQQNLKDFA